MSMATWYFITIHDVMTICVCEGGGLDVGHKDNFDRKIQLCWIVVQSSPTLQLIELQEPLL